MLTIRTLVLTAVLVLLAIYATGCKTLDKKPENRNSTVNGNA